FAANAWCALLETGEMSCWGGNVFAQLGRGSASANNEPLPPGVVPGMKDVVAIGSQATGFCAERADGSLTCWGTQSWDKKSVQVLPPGSLDGPFVGAVDGCAIRKNG